MELASTLGSETEVALGLIHNWIRLDLARERLVQALHAIFLEACAKLLEVLLVVFVLGVNTLAGHPRD
eukprot:2982243-Rhodomonas_salina.1